MVIFILLLKTIKIKKTIYATFKKINVGSCEEALVKWFKDNKNIAKNNSNLLGTLLNGAIKTVQKNIASFDTKSGTLSLIDIIDEKITKLGPLDGLAYIFYCHAIVYTQCAEEEFKKLFWQVYNKLG